LKSRDFAIRATAGVVRASAFRHPRSVLSGGCGRDGGWATVQSMREMPNRRET